MKINQRFIFGLLIALTFISASAQAQFSQSFGYFEDALRYSQTQTGGTARMQALGGAGTAVGGEISSAWLNPAGLGMMQHSGFFGSPFLTVGSTDASYLNTETTDFRLNANVSQFGGAFHIPNRNVNSKYKGGTIAFTFSRMADFQNNLTYQGTSDSLSIIDYFLERAQGIAWSELDNEISGGIFSDEGLAYQTFLINPDLDFDTGNENTYFSFVEPARHEQQEIIQRRGAQNQWNLAYGGNYDDILFFGASVGIQSFRYEQERTYSEFYGSTSPLNDLDYRDQLTARGVGANLSLGAILRLPMFRLGWQIVTPTIMYVDEEYTADLLVNYNNVEFESFTLNQEFGETVILESNYLMTTPFRTSLGASIFVGKSGFITGEVEYVNYSQARLFEPSFAQNLEGDNDVIRNLYASALNFKGGAEIRIDPIRIRGGVAYYADPVDDAFDQSQIIYSGGLGFVNDNFAFDLVVKMQQFDQAYSPFTFSNPQFNPNVDFQTSRLTLGTSFSFFF
ncbi:MAG: hypothetical protein AAF740_07665 [Bacteroidota bacterium]